MRRPLMLMLTLRRTLMLVGCLACLPGLRAYAQGTPADSARLPDLEPSEYVIRGAAQVALPSASRPALTGMHQPPGQTVIPEGRRPFTEEYKQDRSALPENPMQRPEAPGISSLTGKTPLTGEVEALVGRYVTRSVRGRVGAPLSARASVIGRVSYQGSAGHQPFTGPFAFRAPYDALDVLGGLSTHGRYVAAGGNIDGDTQKYRLFGSQSPQLALAENGYPERQYANGGAGLWLDLRGERRVRLHSGLRFETSGFETERPDPVRTAPSRLSEQRLSGQFNLTTPGAGALVADAAFSSAGVDGRLRDYSTAHLNAAAAYRFRYGADMQLSVGGRLLTYAVTDDAPGAAADDKTLASANYILPDALLEFTPSPGFRLYARNTPTLQPTSARSIFEKNPFVEDEPLLRPVLFTLNAEGGAEIFAGPVQLSGKAGYQRSPSFQYFEFAGAGGNFLAAVRYDEAKIAYLGADATAAVPGRLQASLGVTLRDGWLTDLDAEIPYFGAVVGRGLLAVTFADGRAQVQVVADYESARYHDLRQTRTIGDFFDADLAASYQITNNIGLSLRAENLSADRLERWENYPLAPTMVSLGANIRF